MIQGCVAVWRIARQSGGYCYGTMAWSRLDPARHRVRLRRARLARDGRDTADPGRPGRRRSGAGLSQGPRARLTAVRGFRYRRRTCDDRSREDGHGEFSTFGHVDGGPGARAPVADHRAWPRGRGHRRGRGRPGRHHGRGRASSPTPCCGSSVLGAVIKVVLVEGAGRYSLATGQTIFEGWRSLGRWTAGLLRAVHRRSGASCTAPRRCRRRRCRSSRSSPTFAALDRGRHGPGRAGAGVARHLRAGSRR